MENIYLDTIGYAPNNRKSDKIYLNIDIFKRLSEGEYNNKNHIAYAFTYLVNISWIYSYLKYDNILSSKTHSPADILKLSSGISKTTRTMEYVTKKNGVLDRLELTENIGRFDLPYWIDNYGKETIVTTIGDILEQEEFTINSHGGKRNITIKKPTFLLSKSSSREDTFIVDYYNLYNIIYIHKLGYIEFYIYSYLKMKNQYYGENYNESIDSLSSNLKITEKTLKTSLSKMKMLPDFSIKKGGMFEGKYLSNSYTINQKTRRKET